MQRLIKPLRQINDLDQHALLKSAPPFQPTNFVRVRFCCLSVKLFTFLGQALAYLHHDFYRLAISQKWNEWQPSCRFVSFFVFFSISQPWADQD